MPIFTLFGQGTGAIFPPPPGGIASLAQIEQAAAPRLGPYYLRVQSTVTPATVSTAYFDVLKSSANPGDVENLFMLRRGIKTDGTLITVIEGDRQRVGSTYDPLTGGVVPDRAWATAPLADELVEFHHLDPVQELRPAVFSGLRRCFFEDRVSVTLTSVASERDLTAVIPWLSRPDQVRRIQFTAPSSFVLPGDLRWAAPFESGGHVWLGAWPDQYPNNLLITGLRPHFSWVNGADSAVGPTADLDSLSVDVEYAAAAAHIEAWRLFRAKLQAAAAGGFQATQQEAANEFSRHAIINRRPRRNNWSLDGPFGSRRLSGIG